MSCQSEDLSTLSSSAMRLIDIMNAIEQVPGVEDSIRLQRVLAIADEIHDSIRGIIERIVEDSGETNDPV